MQRVHHQTAEAVRKRPRPRQRRGRHPLEHLNFHARRGAEQQLPGAHRERGGKLCLRVGAEVNLSSAGINKLAHRDSVASGNVPEPATEGLTRQRLGNSRPCSPAVRPCGSACDLSAIDIHVQPPPDARARSALTRRGSRPLLHRTTVGRPRRARRHWRPQGTAPWPAGSACMFRPGQNGRV